MLTYCPYQQLMIKNESELQLQSRLRNDDKKALEEVYLKNKLAFINYAIGFDISKSIALDIYQESIITLYQNFITNKIVLEKGSIKTYLFGIGKNKIYKFLKEQNKLIRKTVNQDEYVEIKIEENQPTDFQIKLSKNLKLISESCQNILKLYYYRNLTIDEIVEQTAYKDSNTVRSHKSRCMKRLKTLFKVVK